MPASSQPFSETAEEVILPFRQGLDLCVNLRPAKIEYEERIVDACAMRMILKPEHFDIVVANRRPRYSLIRELGEDHSIFEPVHGEGETLTPDIGGSSSTDEIAASVSHRLAQKEF